MYATVRKNDDGFFITQVCMTHTQSAINYSTYYHTIFIIYTHFNNNFLILNSTNYYKINSNCDNNLLMVDL